MESLLCKTQQCPCVVHWAADGFCTAEDLRAHSPALSWCSLLKDGFHSMRQSITANMKQQFSFGGASALSVSPVFRSALHYLLLFWLPVTIRSIQVERGRLEKLIPRYMQPLGLCAWKRSFSFQAWTADHFSDILLKGLIPVTFYVGGSVCISGGWVSCCDICCTALTFPPEASFMPVCILSQLCIAD